jgi:O-antigen ligase
LIWFIELFIGFTLPFQDLPRIHLPVRLDIRIAYLVLPILLGWLLFHVRSLKPVFQKHRTIFAALLLLVLYLIFHLTFILHDTRALGFFVWFLFNVFLLVYVLLRLHLGKMQMLGVGFMLACITGAIHIFLQRVDPFLWVDPAKIFNLVDHQSRYRVFSWFGEPSYACLNLLFAFLTCLVLPRRLATVLALILGSACLTTYSKVAWVGLPIALLMVAVGMRKAEALKHVLRVSGVLIVVFGLTQLFPNRFQLENNPAMSALNNPTINLEVKNKVTSEDPKPLLMRTQAYERGMIIIKQAPWFGVGLGNSAKFNSTHPKIEGLGWLEGLHNLYQEIWAELGLVGLILFLSLLAGIFFQFKMAPPMYAYWFTMLVTMQVCQNINMPVIWLGLIVSISTNFQNFVVQSSLCHRQKKP